MKMPLHFTCSNCNKSVNGVWFLWNGHFQWCDKCKLFMEEEFNSDFSMAYFADTVKQTIHFNEDRHNEDR